MTATNKPKFHGSVVFDALSQQHNNNITHMVSETDRLLRILDPVDKAGYVKQARDHLELAHIFSRKAIAVNQIAREKAKADADGEIPHAETLDPAGEIPSAPTNPNNVKGDEP